MAFGYYYIVVLLFVCISAPNALALSMISLLFYYRARLQQREYFSSLSLFFYFINIIVRNVENADPSVRAYDSSNGSDDGGVYKVSKPNDGGRLTRCLLSPIDRIPSPSIRHDNKSSS